MSEKSSQVYDIHDILSPRTKILILLADLVDKNNLVEEQEFLDLVLDLNYEMNILTNYSNEHSAKRALRYHLSNLEKEGIIKRIYKDGSPYIQLQHKVPEMNIVKLRRVYNDKVLIGSIVLSFLLFMYTILTISPLETIIISGLNFLCLILVFLSFKIKFVY